MCHCDVGTIHGDQEIVLQSPKLEYLIGFDQTFLAPGGGGLGWVFRPALVSGLDPWQLSE